MLTLAPHLLLSALLLAQPDGRAGGAAGLAPTLDEAKGAAAIAAYGASREQFCSPRPDGVGDATANEVGISCEPAPAVTALASGSFLRPGADQVLLDVPSGRSVGEGERTLVIMERVGGGYRLAQPISGGNGFEVRARIAVPRGRDLLFLCDRSGHQGVYPTVCGFLGQGYFRPRAKDGAKVWDGGIDLPIGWIATCGPAAAISLGHLARRGDRLTVEVVVEEFRLQANGPDEDPSFCTKRTDVIKQRLVVTYQLSAKGARRLTSIPQRVRDLEAKYDF